MKVPPFLSTKDKIFEADEYTRDLNTAFAKVRETLQKSQEWQKKAADRHRRDLKLKENDWITERINNVFFLLRLPDTWKIYNALHVSLLKPVKGDVADVGEPDEQPEVEDNEEILIPEQIVAHKDMKKVVIEGNYIVFKRGVAIGLVVALDYKNPYLNIYEEFQRYKIHPAIRPILEGGTVLEYGARSLNEGGFQSIPKPVFPGGALIGCSAGFLNVPKIKGTHTSMKSGMLAAEAAFATLSEEPESEPNMEGYWKALRSSWVWDELYKARNFRPAFGYGLLPGLAVSAFERYISRGRFPWTLKHREPDHEATQAASLHKEKIYPKPDGSISFDLLTSLYRSNTNHDHDQPAHLLLKDPKVPEKLNMKRFAGPESRYCPARVYEYVTDEKGELKLHINAQNCLHCKACDIKDASQNIEWTVPEGGGGPGYSLM
ncbi:hypothetical protein L7F22_025116 [Adiantum nelumboides]|nr:hypothetical protein [Adiantum nelumboides]